MMMMNDADWAKHCMVMRVNETRQSGRLENTLQAVVYEDDMNNVRGG